METSFDRKPNDYKLFRFIVVFLSPIIYILDIVIFLYLWQVEQSLMIVDMMIFGFMIVLGILSVIYLLGRQLQSKKSYSKMTEPILTLTESNIIYKLNFFEEYTIPWSAIISIDKDTNMPSIQNRIGNIVLTCNDEYTQYIKEIKKSAGENRWSETVNVSVKYVDCDYGKLYDTLVEYYNKSKNIND